MSRHTLKYHIGLPLLVFGALLLFGMPVSRAFSYGIAAGCAAMMVMMMSGQGHGQPPRDDTESEPDRTETYRH